MSPLTASQILLLNIQSLQGQGTGDRVTGQLVLFHFDWLSCSWRRGCQVTQFIDMSREGGARAGKGEEALSVILGNTEPQRARLGLSTHGFGAM